LLWSDGSGADVMKRIAAPMVGGLVTSAFLTLEIIPVIYTYWRNEQLVVRRLSEVAPAAVRELTSLTRVVQAGAVLLVLSLVLRLYLQPHAALLAAHVTGAVTLGLGSVAYVFARRTAMKLIPDHAQLSATEPSPPPASPDDPGVSHAPSQ
jgi:dolichol kinase